MTAGANIEQVDGLSLSKESFKYAVIDLASAKVLRPFVRDLLPSTAEPLFARTAARSVLDVGPWLVRVSKAPELAEALGQMDPETPWGFYIYAGIDIVSLRQRLRRMNLVRIAGEDREVLFRYWDPRVMKVFLDVISSQQRERFFEWIDRIEAANDEFAMDLRG